MSATEMMEKMNLDINENDHVSGGGGGNRLSPPTPPPMINSVVGITNPVPIAGLFVCGLVLCCVYGFNSVSIAPIVIAMIALWLGSS